MEQHEMKDFTELTCTNLMIKLKILLKRTSPGEAVSFIATREQVDNTCTPFTNHGYAVECEQVGENRYNVQIGTK
jgi:hypothetical protein